MSENKQYLTEEHYLVCPKAVAFKKMKVTHHQQVYFSGTRAATTADRMQGNAFMCIGGSSGIFGMSIIGVAGLAAGVAVCCLACPIPGWAMAAIIGAALLLAAGAGYLKCRANMNQRIWLNHNPNLYIHGEYGLIVKESVLHCVPEATDIETKETFWEALFSQTLANLGHIANFCEMFLTGLGIGGFAKQFVKELGEEGLKAAFKGFGKEFLRVAKEEIKDQFDPRNIVQSWKDGHRFCALMKGFGLAGQAKDIYDTLTDEELSAFDKAKKLGLEFIQSIFMAKGATEVCFPAGTPIHTEKGLKNIESLQVGDFVWTYNEVSGEKELKPIRMTHKRTTLMMMTVELADGTIFEVTPEHRFLVENNWMEIQQIKALDKVNLFDGNQLEILNLALLPKVQTVYNFDVEGNENYYVTESGVLVHNGYKDDLPTRDNVARGDAGDYQSRTTGNTEYQVSGSGEKVWADGIDDTGTIVQDAKYVGNEARSPFIEDSNIPPFIREKIDANLQDEFYRYSQVLSDQSNPLQSLEVITNNQKAVSYFEDLMNQYNISGKVTVTP